MGLHTMLRQGREPSTRFQEIVGLRHDVQRMHTALQALEQRFNRVTSAQAARLELAFEIITTFMHQHPDSALVVCSAPVTLTPADVQACNDALVTRWEATQAARYSANMGAAIAAAFGQVAAGIEASASPVASVQ
jgi:hypothetical protein